MFAQSCENLKVGDLWFLKVADLWLLKVDDL